jgi:hypothetical protein
MKETRPQTARTNRSKRALEMPKGMAAFGEKQMKTENETIQNSNGDAKPTYKPTPAEVEAGGAYLAAKEKRSPRLKVVVTGKNAVQTEVDHPDIAIGSVALMRALGTTDSDFCSGLIGQLVNASKQEEASESGTNFMLSVIKGIEPRDQIEAMLAPRWRRYTWPR